MDTHRVWEILQFGCFPVVLSSPLDLLYSQLPIIILRSWQELFANSSSVLLQRRREILERFGEEEVMMMTREKLSMKYWVELVKKKKRELMFVR